MAARATRVSAVAHARRGGASYRAEPAPRQSEAEPALRKIRPDELGLREALDLVYRLKGLVAE